MHTPPGGYSVALLVRVSSNRRYSHRSVFEREGGMGSRAPALGRLPVPERRKPPMLDGGGDHRRLGPRPRGLDGVPTIRRREETGPTSLRLLRSHGDRGERLPSRTGPGTIPPRHVP